MTHKPGATLPHGEPATPEEQERALVEDYLAECDNPQLDLPFDPPLE